LPQHPHPADKRQLPIARIFHCFEGGRRRFHICNNQGTAEIATTEIFPILIATYPYSILLNQTLFTLRVF
jgi:hypothetical protein